MSTKTVLRVLTDHELQIVTEWAERGAKDYQIARAIGMANTTFSNIKCSTQDRHMDVDSEGHKYNVLEEAVREGKARFEDLVLDKFNEKIHAGDKTCIMFYLRAHGWSVNPNFSQEPNEDLVQSDEEAAKGLSAEELEELASKVVPIRKAK